MQEAWPVLEPNIPLVWNWHLDALCEHLEAITFGDITRLLVNIPPGSSKSLVCSVMWPAWEWAMGFRSLRYLTTSHNDVPVKRDTRKMRDLILSDWYQALFPEVVLVRTGETSFANSATGTREGVAFKSLTSQRGDRLLIDDPHSVETAESDAERENTTRRFREGALNRLNDQAKSAIVVVMQRLHEDDVSGVILSNDMGFEHLCLPMEFEPDRRCETSIGFADPRTKEGDLLDPVRFSRKVVEGLKRDMGSFAWAGQYQQRPSARGGGIIKRENWRLWDDDAARLNDLKASTVFPPMLAVIGSLDTAYTTKEQNDPSAFTLWGIWKDRTGRKRLMLMYAWAERLELHELVEKAAKDCRRFRADTLLIEAKASGISVAQEIRRLFANEDWSVRLLNPGALDKVARAYQTQPMFEQGLIWAPDRTWAQRVIDEAAVFPRGKHDDLVDSTVQALTHIRQSGLLALSGETHDDWDREEPRAVDSLYWKS